MAFFNAIDKVFPYQKRLGILEKPEAIVIHHTGPANRPQQIFDTFNERQFPAHFVIDKEGNIWQTLSTGVRGRHLKASGNFVGQGARADWVNNANAIGIEIMAENDDDISQVQLDAAKGLIEQIGKMYNINLSSSVFGHGELNPGHKQLTEGQKVARLFRPDAGILTAATPADRLQSLGYGSVKQFQIANGLEPDGIVGPKTLEKMKQSAPRPKEPIPQGVPAEASPVNPDIMDPKVPLPRPRVMFAEVPAGTPSKNLKPLRTEDAIINPDKTKSLARARTYGTDEGFVNYPSLWIGPDGVVELNEEDTFKQGQQYEADSKIRFPRYDTEEIAVNESKAAPTRPVALPRIKPSNGPEKPPVNLSVIDQQINGRAGYVGRGSAPAPTLEVQKFLNQSGILSKPIAEDGKFGMRTKRAVKEYQTAHGIKVDGIVGKQTYARMLRDAAPIPLPRPRPEAAAAKIPFGGNQGGNYQDFVDNLEAQAIMEKDHYTLDPDEMAQDALTIYSSLASFAEKVDNGPLAKPMEASKASIDLLFKGL